MTTGMMYFLELKSYRAAVKYLTMRDIGTAAFQEGFILELKSYRAAVKTVLGSLNKYQARKNSSYTVDLPLRQC